mgnify:FL=1
MLKIKIWNHLKSISKGKVYSNQMCIKMMITVLKMRNMKNLSKNRKMMESKRLMDNNSFKNIKKISNKMSNRSSYIQNNRRNRIKQRKKNLNKNLAKRRETKNKK